MIYNHPRVYELAFSFRDIESETAFIDRVIRTFSRRPVRSVLEIASGPAPHAGALTERGYRYIGLDNNPAMIDYARTKWQELTPAPSFVQADMASFALPEPADFMYVLLGSLYLSTADAMQSHLDSVAAALRPGGLYFLDLCIEFSDPLSHGSCRHAVTERDNIRLDSRFDIRLLDPQQNLYEERWRLKIETPEGSHAFETVEQNVALFPDDFATLIGARPEFDLVGWWADWDLDAPITPSSRLYRPFALLRRN